MFIIYRLPTWTQKVLVPGGNFVYLAEYWLELTTSTTEMKRLKSGFLLKEILDRFKNKTISILSPDRSLWIYSSHDTTIAAMLNSLGVFDVISLKTQILDAILNIFLLHFSSMFHHIRPVFSSNCTNQLTTTMCNSFTETQQQMNTRRQQISQIVAQNVH